MLLIIFILWLIQDKKGSSGGNKGDRDVKFKGKPREAELET